LRGGIRPVGPSRPVGFVRPPPNLPAQIRKCVGARTGGAAQIRKCAWTRRTGDPSAQTRAAQIRICAGTRRAARANPDLRGDEKGRPRKPGFAWGHPPSWPLSPRRICAPAR